MQLSKRTEKPRSLPRKLLHIRFFCGSYLTIVFAVWICIAVAGDRWWPATLALFGPRWLVSLPLMALIPAAIWYRRGWMLILPSAWIVLIQIMGFNIPWRGFFPRASPSPTLRVLTCNIHRSQLNPAALAQLISSVNPDVVALQEWTSRFDPLFDSSWNTRREGELFIASRLSIGSVTTIEGSDWAGPGQATTFTITTTFGKVNITNLHLASPHSQFEDVLDRGTNAGSRIESNSKTRLIQSRAVRLAVANLGGGMTLLMGDFNTPDDSAIFRTAWTDLSDAFRVAGWGFGYTYHAKKTLLRIDHILASSGWQCDRCWVGPDIGSPHRPLIAELRWIGPPP
jgi:vancomycin resistance protein VanJ